MGVAGDWACLQGNLGDGVVFTHMLEGREEYRALQRENRVMHKKNGRHIDRKRIEMKEASAVERT